MILDFAADSSLTDSSIRLKSDMQKWMYFAFDVNVCWNEDNMKPE